MRGFENPASRGRPRPNREPDSDRLARQEHDERLVDRIVKRDPTAYAQFYDRHAPRILGLLLRGLRNRADAEDVLQDVFCQVWRKAAQYTPHRSSPEVWLTLIARSRLLDFVRRKRPESGGALIQTAGAPWDPLDSIARDESTQRIRWALGRLPEEQRSAILLAFFGGLTHQQVAHQQNIPLGTAKTRILLGIRSLRRMLSPVEDAPAL